MPSVPRCAADCAASSPANRTRITSKPRCTVPASARNRNNPSADSPATSSAQARDSSAKSSASESAAVRVEVSMQKCSHRPPTFLPTIVLLTSTSCGEPHKHAACEGEEIAHESASARGLSSPRELQPARSYHTGAESTHRREVNAKARSRPGPAAGSRQLRRRKHPQTAEIGAVQER